MHLQVSTERVRVTPSFTHRHTDKKSQNTGEKTLKCRIIILYSEAGLACRSMPYIMYIPMGTFSERTLCVSVLGLSFFKCFTMMSFPDCRDILLPMMLKELSAALSGFGDGPHDERRNSVELLNNILEVLSRRDVVRANHKPY